MRLCMRESRARGKLKRQCNPLPRRCVRAETESSGVPDPACSTDAIQLVAYAAGPGVADCPVSPSRSRADDSTFTRDAKAVVEREQALLLLRAVMALPRDDRGVALTEGLIRAVVSAAENPDDAMRIVCMETLVEIGGLLRNRERGKPANRQAYWTLSCWSSRTRCGRYCLSLKTGQPSWARLSQAC
jgi:hypothetical protein